jgi:hypothetical protein
MLLWQIADLAWSLALLRAGSNIDIKSDIIAIITNSSISVKARLLCIPDPAIVCGKINDNCHYMVCAAHNQTDNPPLWTSNRRRHKPKSIRHLHRPNARIKAAGARQSSIRAKNKPISASKLTIPP